MIHYPLNHRETRVVRWTSTVLTVVSVATLALLGTLAFAAS